MKRASLLAIIATACAPQAQTSPDGRASAQVSTDRSAASITEFIAVTDLEPNTDLSPLLRGARPAVPSEWPASFYTRSGGGRCTSTLVASTVLLTAAHCVPDGGEIRLTRAGTTVVGRCDHASGYRGGNATADYALCLLGAPVTQVRYENVNRDPAAVRVGAQLRLTGYGCTAADGSGGNDGTYRIGEAPVIRLPTGADNDIVTRGDVALCMGDSGGPAFALAGTGPASRRLAVVSVNSRVENRSPDGIDLGRTSYLSSTSTVEALRFLDGWAASKNVRICGLSPAATGCRT